MRSKLFSRSILFVIILIAIFFRFYNLSTVPPSASVDEASVGYNAYSILKTGVDEYGTKYPLIFRAYDDWQPALYLYFVMPFIKIFGLNVLSVRLPAVIFSVLTVIATYFLVQELLKINSKFEITKHWKFKIGNLEFGIPEAAALFLAINPWHIYLSRLGFQANIGLAFFIFALLFFFKKRIYLTFIFLVLSFISYHTEKIFIPVLFLGIFFIFRKEMLQMKKKVLFASIIAFIIVVPFLKESFSENALIRFKATNVFTAERARFEKQVLLLDKAVKENNVFGKVIYNRRVLALQIFGENYISHFNPIWLFSDSLNNRHKAPGLGLLYIWEMPLIVCGFFVLLFFKFDPKIKKIIILWILVSPLAGALTTDAPHAVRSYVFLPSWQILSALGLFFIFSRIKNVLVSKVFFIVFGIVIFISLGFFYKQYFLVFPKTQSSSFQYAVSGVVPFVLENERSYNKVIFSNQENLYQSYMFFLFYSKYDPALYQKQGGTKSGGFAETHKFGKYEFRPINWEKEEKNNKYLFLGNISNFSNNIDYLEMFSNLDETKVIGAVNK